MVTYNEDFTGLTYIDSRGLPITVLFTDGAEFNRLAAIRDEQLTAVRENQTAINNYNQIIKNDQLSEDASRPYPPPPQAPSKKVVNDIGGVSWVPFGTDELLAIKLKTDVVVSSGSIKSVTGLPADPMANLSAQNTVILAQLSAIMSALKKAGLL